MRWRRPPGGHHHVAAAVAVEDVAGDRAHAVERSGLDVCLAAGRTVAQSAAGGAIESGNGQGRDVFRHPRPLPCEQQHLAEGFGGDAFDTR